MKITVLHSTCMYDISYRLQSTLIWALQGVQQSCTHDPSRPGSHMWDYDIHMLKTHISVVQAAFTGFFILYPLSNWCEISKGWISGYGILPPLKTSQHVTPKDHCSMVNQIIGNFFLMSYTYHVSFFWEDAIRNAFWCQPLDRKLHSFLLVLSKVHLGGIHAFRQTKIRYFDEKVGVNPAV